MSGTAQIIRANSRDLPLADNSVDLVVTSPPYFALRSYQDGGEHYAGQIGDEPTPAEFVDSLLEVTRECVRVLKPSGSLWVNLGDKYASSGTTPIKRRSDAPESYAQTRGMRTRPTSEWFPHKSLMGLPWRYALRCIDDLGLILRAEVIWSKPNGLPESVTDRVRRSHETWFHFTLQPRYFSAVDEIREAHIAPDRQRGQAPNGASPLTGGVPTIHPANPLGKLPGSVWTIPTQPLKVPDHLGVDHFAAFPMEFPRRIIQGWSPSGVCVECGEGRRPVRHSEGETQRQALARLGGTERHEGAGRQGLDFKGSHTVNRVHSIIGESCACPPWETSPNSSICVECGTDSDWADGCSACGRATAPTTPAVVLDPFGGTGTTALVAKALGRHGISVDMSADYCRLAEWRTNDPKQLAKAARKPFTPPAEQVDGQADLFELMEGGAA